MIKNDILLINEDHTIVAQYECKKRDDKEYQTEKELEDKFISDLIEQGYEYLKINNENELKINLRKQIEKLNNISFTEIDWEKFLKQISHHNLDTKGKTKIIQNDRIINLKMEDGTSKNIKIIDEKSIHNNNLQVINQYQTNDGKYKNIYDVSILVNGLPLVHVELKKRGVKLRNAFNQIERYKKDSFWSGIGLFEFVQIYVISNGTETKYFSNTIRENKKENIKKGNKTLDNNSFKFTSYWTDSKNNQIKDLNDFTKTFFSRHAILNIIIKFCVFTAQNELLVMRPYQICAAESILRKVNTTSLNNLWSKEDSGGYIWHTTGSGKTLTSFKTAQILKKNENIDKILFVVDRKDLDYQTIIEYEKYEKNSVSANDSTKELFVCSIIYVVSDD